MQTTLEMEEAYLAMLRGSRRNSTVIRTGDIAPDFLEDEYLKQKVKVDFLRLQMLGDLDGAS